LQLLRADPPSKIGIATTVTHKLLRAIRLDASDTFVYDRAAVPGEWLVSGAFMFWDQDLSRLEGRAKQAFRAGLLGITSAGWSTLGVVVEATADERQTALNDLATYLMAKHGAPTLADATAAAAEELTFAEGLAQHAIQTLVAVHRTVNADGEIAEQFRTFHAADAKQATAMPCSAGAFAVVDDDAATDDGAGDHFDLAGMVKAQTAQAAKS
jgi:Family of unknown function (DUF6505)